jgi:hypothetical protein
MDPFEEIGMAEKNAGQHRRSATENEVWASFSCQMIYMKRNSQILSWAW